MPRAKKNKNALDPENIKDMIIKACRKLAEMAVVLKE